MKVSLKNIIVPSIPLAIFLVICCVVLWFSAYVGHQIAPTTLQSPALQVDLEFFISPNSLLSNLISIAFTLLNAFLLAQINNRFTIIRTRTFMPLFIFLFVMASWRETHIANSSHLVLTLFILSLFKFFSMSRDRNASEPAFMGTFLVSVCSILINPLVFLIPVCWFGFIIFQSFSLRTFLASIFGASAPWILFLAGKYMLQSELDIQQIISLQPNLGLLYITDISLPVLVYSALFMAILVLSIAGMYSLSYNDAIHTRNKLNFLVMLIIALIILTVLFRNQFSLFLPLIAFVFSLLFSHPFTLKQTRFNWIVFIVFCVLNIAYVISKYILI